MDTDPNGLEVLTADECLDLLRRQSVGRIAIDTDALPVILPVNYIVLGDDIVIRTRRGTRLADATRHSIVAFEVDDFDADTEAGWSVMVQGVAREVLDPLELEEARAAVLARWLDPDDSRHVSISMDVITGRRLPCPAVSRSTNAPDSAKIASLARDR
ncbi:MAG TPA: pyridoxamine 5'-phosphate oxidase family protein [Microthrixaceae bacterium]|nr:pyridoxamine 5'-phosphate oxidase family protein [Microthrixaceae bacterium]